MTVLLEGISLVFENRVLDARYPGGTLGFRATWDNGSFCSDGTISRIAFFEKDDAFCTLMAMPDYGLEVSTHFSVDVAVFLHGGVPWVPCLWLEVSAGGAKTRVCWHVAEEQRNRVAVPAYFRTYGTLARYGNLDEAAIMARVTRAGKKCGVALFRDVESKRIFAGPMPLQRH